MLCFHFCRIRGVIWETQLDKNLIWAIVLSTVVVIASYLFIPMFMGKNNVSEVPETVSEQPEELDLEKTEFESENNTFEIAESAENEDEQSSVTLNEETFTIVTDKVEVVLTNKGGDIISYKLKDHLDMDTNEGVQLSDNVSEINRTCALSFGPAGSSIVNEVFETEKIDDYTYFFKKNLTVNGQKISLGKKYSFKPGEYVFKLDIMIHTFDKNGLNIDDASYTLRTSPQIGPHYNPKQNKYEYRQFVTYNGSKYKKINLGNEQFKKNDKDSIWTGIAGKYFIELVVPSSPENINATYYSTKIEVNDYANAQGLVERKAFSENDISDTYYMYFGPRDDKELKRYNVSESNAWGLGGKKLSEALQTSGWLNWLEKILKFVMEILYKIIPNWGATIIVMTLLLKIILFPLSKKQSLGTLKMQQVQPRMAAIQAKYKDDPKRLQLETQKLYQETGYNPMSGCLPMIFQFLVIFAMYNLFNNYFEFRGAMFIPGWIPDLSSGDSIVTLNFNIPLLGNQIRLLPVIYVGTQLLSGKITQYGQPSGGQNAGSMKFMMYGMPLIFFFMFYNAPAGLLLYWLTSNVLQIVQQLIINKIMKEKREEMNGNQNNKKLPPKAKSKQKK